MYKNKLNKILNLIDKVKTDINLPIISDFLDWFYEIIEINFDKKIPDLKLNKWDIYFVKLWQNIWSELNKNRPCIVLSHYYFNNWDNITVIPLKSYKWKINKNIHILIKKSDVNNLESDSILDISTIRQISKKRILFKIWKLEDIFIEKINKRLLKYLWIKK